MARSFGWTERVDLAMRLELSVLAVACLAGAWFAKDRRRLLLGSALLAVFPAWPLWEVVHLGVPLLDLQRGPGHFADLLPFSLSLLLGLALTAMGRAMARPAAANLLVAALGVLVVIDYGPSRAAFEEGTPLRSIREGRAMLADLDGEDGTLRIGLLESSETAQDLVTTGSQLGWAGGWLRWQAGRDWIPYRDRASWPSEPRARRRPPGYDRLLEIARIRYFLRDKSSGVPPLPPWRRVRQSESFSLWEQPKVGPMAAGYRSFVLVTGEPRSKALDLVPQVSRFNALVASVERLADHPELVAAASAVFSVEGWLPDDEASKAVAERHAGKIFELPYAAGRWRAALAREPVRSVFEVKYARPAPEHVRLSVDAGASPAEVFVAEGYHPWWRAVVDGNSAPVLRAQMAFMAVPVPAGTHTIDLRFTRPSLVGLADSINAVAWLTVPIVAVVLALRARRTRSREG